MWRRTGGRRTRTRTLLTNCKDLQNNLQNIMNTETATSASATHPAVTKMQANKQYCISPVNSQQCNVSLVHSVGDISVLEINCSNIKVRWTHTQGQGLTSMLSGPGNGRHGWGVRWYGLYLNAAASLCRWSRCAVAAAAATVSSSGILSSDDEPSLHKHRYIQTTYCDTTYVNPQTERPKHTLAASAHC